MLPNPTPTKLPGTVIAQYGRCGKRKCSCVEGKLHGPYWYRFYRDDNRRLHKAYVRKADVDTVRAACAERQREAAEARGIVERGQSMLRWLTNGGPSTADFVDAFEHMLDLETVVEELLDVTLYGMGSARDQIETSSVLEGVTAALEKFVRDNERAEITARIMGCFLGAERAG